MAGWDDAELSRLRSQFGAEWGVQPEAIPKGYNPGNTFKEDEEEADEFEFAVSPDAPADLTDIPTSSINVSRPRTVAAGYDRNRQIMTVVFRDGTIWNYKKVTPGEWSGFHASISKGRPWLNKGGLFYNKTEQGPADMSAIAPEIAAEVYRYSRAAQLKYATKYKYSTGASNTRVQRVSKTASSRSVLKPGKNPSKGGKNPNQK